MSEQKQTTKLSAVIACYKDAESIPQMHVRLKEVFETLKVDYEIIFVNDGSPDDSKIVLRELCDRDAHVIAVNHARNFGSQNAFTSGMKLATGDAVVLLDGDLQDPPEIIYNFYPKWLEGFDVVYGQRIKRDAPIWLQVSYKLFYRLFKKLSYINIPLDAGDFSLIDRKVIDALIKLPERDRFIRGLRAWVGFKQTSVPYVRPERPFGVSTNSFIKNFWWARKAIFSFSYKPLELITLIAFISVGVSFVGIIVQLFLRVFYPTLAPKGFATLIIIILFMGGIQMMSLSVIGTYLSHIYEEVKQRPHFIIESIYRQKDSIKNYKKNK